MRTDGYTEALLLAPWSWHWESRLEGEQRVLSLFASLNQL